MTADVIRVVDAHVHLWDPARTDWYPYLSGNQDIGMETAGMARRFDPEIHARESAGWNVEALVNVAAATGAYSVDETLEMDELARASGQPAAIIGGVTPTETMADAVEQLDRQLAADRFRGVRPMGRFDGPLPSDDVLRALAERDLLFELMAHPDVLVDAATRLAGIDDLRVVVEHAGWPRTDTDDERCLWHDGMAALADVGDRVTCKLSGLAMPLGAVSVEAFAPWIETAIELFGVDRCFFASNFPVDGAHASFDELYSVYAALTAGLDDDDRDALFAANAARVYRIS